MEKKKDLKQSLIQFIKFNLVGVLNTLIDFVVYSILIKAGANIYLAKTISYTCGMVNSYFCNTGWTFKKERQRTKKEFLLFVAVNVASLGVSYGMLWFAKDVLMIGNDYAKWFIATPVSMIVNFLGNKLFVFKKKNNAAQSDENAADVQSADNGAHAEDGEKKD